MEHSIANDYLNDDELLLAVEQVINESGDFRMVLTPANDPESHDDHFHFEAKVDYKQPPVQARSGSGSDRSLRAKRQARSEPDRSKRGKKKSAARRQARASRR
ncbi:MAG TPA: hypothetical protein VNM90_05675 [Haliangium sp.]|nr:hypothetical protein [Haliangium sp.]